MWMVLLASTLLCLDGLQCSWVSCLHTRFVAMGGVCKWQSVSLVACDDVMQWISLFRTLGQRHSPTKVLVERCKRDHSIS